MNIRTIDYEQAKAVIKARHMKAEPHYSYYALTDDGRIISVIALAHERAAIKLKTNYTVPEYRRLGHFSRLLAHVVDLCKGSRLTANCLPGTVNIYRDAGFSEVRRKQHKLFEIVTMTREAI